MKPPSAAKNGTCVVPAWVMSGPEPDTAALRMRSNWTSQPTSWTSTLMPVLAVNGATSFCRSGTGWGELGIVHSVSVTPRWSFGAPPLAACLLDVLPESEPPQAATARARTEATAAGTIADLMRTTTPPWDGNKNVFGSDDGTGRGAGQARHLLEGSGGAADEQLDGKGAQRRAVLVAVDAGDQRLARRRAQAELVLAEGGEGRIQVSGELDVVEADDRDVLGDAQARLGHRPDGP